VGLPPLLLRQIVFGAVKFVAFDEIKLVLAGAGLGEGVALSLVAGGLAGVLSCAVSQPADAVLTRSANTGLGFGDAFKEVMGGRGFFNGFVGRCIWSSSIIAGQFAIYDYAKIVLGVAEKDLNDQLGEVLVLFQ
jgi:hypothetical protein